jgi:hypothetical protein
VHGTTTPPAKASAFLPAPGSRGRRDDLERLAARAQEVQLSVEPGDPDAIRPDRDRVHERVRFERLARHPAVARAPDHVHSALAAGVLAPREHADGDDLVALPLRQRVARRHLDHLARRVERELVAPAVVLAVHDEHGPPARAHDDLAARMRGIELAHGAAAELVRDLEHDFARELSLVAGRSEHADEAG